MAIVLGVGCGGPETPAAEPASQPAPVCSEGYREPTNEPSAEARGKLGGSLATRLQMPSHPCERLVIIVTHTGDLDALVAAGLQAGFDRDGVVSGIIEKRRVLALAELPQVIRIELQPDVQPN